MAEKFSAKLGLDTKEFNSKLGDANRSFQGFNRTLSTSTAAMGAVFTIGAIVNFTKESIKLAASMEGVAAAFKSLNKPDLLNNLRTATRGTVTDLQLMQKAVQARNFKIPLDELASYFEFATKRAIQTGESVDYLVDSIITGIGRKSVLVMDNLGISAVELQEEVKKVGDFGAAAGNIIRRELGSMGDVADTTATKIAEISTAWPDLKTQAGKFFVDIGFGDWLKDVTTWLELWSDPDIPLIGWKSPTSKNLESYRYQKMLEGVTMYSGGESEGGPLAPKPTTEVYIRTLATLNAELEREKELLDTIAIADRKGIENQIKKIQGLEREIELLKEPIRAAAITPAAAPSIPRLFGGAPEGELAGAPQFAEDMTLQMEILHEGITTLEGAFTGMFTNVQNGFQSMVNSFISGLARLAAQILAKAAVFAILSVISGGTTSFAGLAKGIVEGGFGNFMFGKFASGGLAYGPTIGMVGEYAGARSNPEVIAPLDKLKGLMGAQEVRVIVDGKISGRDIRLANRRNGV